MITMHTNPRVAEISHEQDKRDAETMRALIEQRRAYPRTYNVVRDAVACWRHETALKLYRVRRYGQFAADALT